MTKSGSSGSGSSALRRSAWPDTAVSGTVIQITLEQRLITEVRSGRLPAEALSVLSTVG